jgi:alpha-beta hydrolase superfamily lysophospholipase
LIARSTKERGVVANIGRESLKYTLRIRVGNPIEASMKEILLSVLLLTALKAHSAHAREEAHSVVRPSVTGQIPNVEEFRIEEISFYSHSTRLAGSLAVPRSRPVLAAIVFVHGSGKQERDMVWARRFAAEGIAAFVYDKRGAGQSRGEYEEDQSVGEKNINLLADDAVAAFEKVRDSHSLKNIPIGFAGISQAGWIVPVAAEKSRSAKFVLLWSGPVCKVSAEDIYSKFTADRDSIEVPSYAEALGSRKEKYARPDFLGKDTDPKESLEKLSIPDKRGSFQHARLYPARAGSAMQAHYTKSRRVWDATA